MELYDENKAIEFIRRELGDTAASRYDDDEYLNIIDMIMDWYDDNGMTDPDFDTDTDEDDDEEAIVAGLVEYVTRLIRKDKGANVAEADIEPIVRAEIAYENHISEF